MGLFAIAISNNNIYQASSLAQIADMCSRANADAEAEQALTRTSTLHFVESEKHALQYLYVSLNINRLFEQSL